MLRQNEIKMLPTGEKVEKFEVIGTGRWVYSAWKLVKEVGQGCTIQFDDDGKMWVRIGSDPDLSACADVKMPYREHAEAVKAAYNARFEVANNLIMEAFGEELTSLSDDEIWGMMANRGEVFVDVRQEKKA